jgi:hypothetical protein
LAVVMCLEVAVNNKVCPTCCGLGFVDVGDCEDGNIDVCPDTYHDDLSDGEDDE